MKGSCKVYLAGPVAGKTFNEAQGWREQFAAMLDRTVGPAITCYSPLRGKRDVAERSKRIGLGSYEHPLATDRAIMARDHYDCRTADLIVAHLADADRVSLGTCMELAFAYEMNKLVVATLKPGGLHDHPMVRAAITHRARDLDEAALMVRLILCPFVD